MKRLIFALCLSLMPVATFAQDMTIEQPVIDREFKLLSGALVASAIFDAWSTNRALADCPTCRELNPIARPFVEAGPGGTYAFALGTSALLIGGAYVLKKRGYRWKWALILGTTAHVAAGGLNLRYVN